MRALLLLLIKVYQWTISPLIGQTCRFYPSCSHYATQALTTHCLHTALWLIVRRLCRCSGWSHGGVDLVPSAKEKAVTRPSHKPLEASGSPTKISIV